MSKNAAAAAKAEEIVPAETKPVRALVVSRLVLTHASEGKIGNQFAATTPLGQPFEDVLQPEFWAMTAFKLRPGDEITVHTDDMTYLGRLYVRDVAGAAGQRLNNRAVVAQLELHKFGPLKREMRTTKHEVRYLGPHEQWSVIALVDQRVVKGGFGTPDEAAQWMRTQAL